MRVHLLATLRSASDTSVSDDVRRTRRRPRRHRTVHAVAISRDGRVLAAGGDEDHTALWDLADHGSPRLVTRLRDVEPVRGACFRADSRRLYTGNARTVPVGEGLNAYSEPQGGIKAWALRDARPSALGGRRTRPKTLITGLAADATGRFLAAGITHRRSVILWDTTRDPPEQLALLRGDRWPTMAFRSDVDVTFGGPDGQWLAACVGRDTVTVWDLSAAITPPATGPPPMFALARRRPGRRTWRPPGRTAVALHPSRGVLATSTPRWGIEWWTLPGPDGRPVRSGRMPTPGDITSMAFSPAGDLLAVTGPRIGAALVDTSDPAHPHSLTQLATPDESPTCVATGPLPLHASEPTTCASTPGTPGTPRAPGPHGTLVAIGHSDGTVRLWTVDGISSDPVAPVEDRTPTNRAGTGERGAT